ncbi:MAG: hypothetical protein R2715_00200 [Ilumatobacteraceae bacterium]
MPDPVVLVGRVVVLVLVLVEPVFVPVEHVRGPIGRQRNAGGIDPW